MMSKEVEVEKEGTKHDQDDSTSQTKSKSIMLGYEVKENGVLDIESKFKIQFDIKYRIAKAGVYLVCFGVLLVFFAPLLYFVDIISTPSLVLTIVTSPFGIGAGLIKLSERFEYFPGVK